MTAPPHEMTGSADVVVVQTAIPDYRVRFFASLSEELGCRLMLVSGDRDFDVSLVHVLHVPHAYARNRFFARRRLLWQSGVLRRVGPARIAVLELNPRILSTWVVLVYRHVRRRRTILWGHAWPRKGMASRTDRLRDVMRRFADTLIVYTETEARQVRDISEVDVVAAPNALYSKRDLDPLHSASSPQDFLFVGRLVSEKKPGLLLDAFHRAERKLPPDVRLVFIGDGPLRAHLEATAQHLRLSERVLFSGHVSALDDLRCAYSRAIASVLPGTAGLSLIQSLGFGVPALVASTERHGPEMEAGVDGENMQFFPSDSGEALASVLVSVAQRREDWLLRRSAIARPIRNKYCIETMVTRFVAALRIDEGRNDMRK